MLRVVRDTIEQPVPTVHSPFGVISGPKEYSYRSRVEDVYAGDPEVWKKVLGESLMFHHGVYNGADRSLAEAAAAYLDAQLEIAGISEGAGIRRVLDIGCGWGGVLSYLAERFPACERLDGINISSVQLEYTAKRMHELGIDDRVALHLCDAQDIDLLPHPQRSIDLVIARGSLAHFTFDVLKEMAAAVRRRTSSGSILIIAEVLYNNLDAYRSVIEDTVDRLGCGYRKSPAQIRDVLHRNGFTVKDIRVLPTSEDAIRWFTELRTNIDMQFPRGVPLPALDELRDVTRNLEAPLARGDVAAYSIVAIRD